MKEININVTETGCQRSPLLIGYQGENKVTRVIVDYSAWMKEFGAGSLTLEVMRSGDEIPYLAPLTIADGKAVWLVSNVDTGAEGVGAAGLVYTVGDQIKKSAVFRFFVGRDIGGDPGERPDPYEGVIAHIEKLVKEAEDNAAAAETAQTAAEAAQTAAEAARDAAASSATDAAGSATTAAQSAQDAADDADRAEAAKQAVEDLGVTAHEDPDGPSVEKSVDPETGAVTLDFGFKPAGVTEVNGQTGVVSLDAEDVSALPDSSTLDDIPDGATYKRPTAAQLQQIQTNATDIQTQGGEIDRLQADVEAIEQKIPNQASSTNQLADKAFVNSSINSAAAFFRGAFPTRAALFAVAWQSTDPQAENYVSNNDYAYVADDETHNDEAWRYIYVFQPGGTGNGWQPQFRVNESPLTAAQLAALNSGATAALIEQISTNAAAIALKQAIINATGILKGNGNGQVSAAVAGTDYLAPGALAQYRTAAAQDVIDAAQDTEINKKADTEDVYSKEAVNARDDALYAAILSGGGDYKATMRSFFLANGANAMVDLTALCDRWYKLSRTGWTGGVRFSQPQEGVTMSSDGTKTGDNAGLSCTPSTTTEANRDDYAALPLFAVVDCNVTLDDDGKPHVTAIDGIAGGFQRYDPAKIVCCMQMTGWMRFVEEEDVFGFDYTDQPEAEGFAPLPEAVELKDNAVRSWVVHCKYGAGDTWGSCSGVPLRVWDVSHNTAHTQVRAVWGSRYCAATSADDAFIKIMLYLKYAQLDSDRILSGCVDYNYTYKLALGEAGVERVLLTPAQAANLIVGSCVCVGTASSRNANKGQQTALLDRVRIVRIETVEIDGTSYGAVYVDNGGNTFDSAATYYLYTYQWHTGSTDGVLGNDGGINPTSTRYPVKLQGIEILSGCYEVMGDTILRYEVSGGVNCEVAHVCRDASKIATGVTADYKTCAYGTPCPASNSWQYPKRLGHDAALPEVMLGSVLGGSTSSGPRDGFYIEKYSANAVREWLRWGYLSNGLGNAGLSCGTGGLGSADWAIGGRLSVTGNRGEYQAAA